MAYIKAEDVIKKIFPYDAVDKKCYSINAKAVYDAIKKTPTADVVPREEVERLLEDFQGSIRADAKVGMSAGEILMHIHNMLAELKKKYIGDNK